MATPGCRFSRIASLSSVYWTSDRRLRSEAGAIRAETYADTSVETSRHTVVSTRECVEWIDASHFDDVFREFGSWTLAVDAHEAIPIQFPEAG